MREWFSPRCGSMWNSHSASDPTRVIPGFRCLLQWLSSSLCALNFSWLPSLFSSSLIALLLFLLSLPFSSFFPSFLFFSSSSFVYSDLSSLLSTPFFISSYYTKNPNLTHPEQLVPSPLPLPSFISPPLLLLLSCVCVCVFPNIWMGL